MLKKKYKKFIQDTLGNHPADLSEQDMEYVFKIFESFLDIVDPRSEDISEDKIRAVAETVMFSVTNILSLLQEESV